MREVVVDTDCGVDDALALLILLRDPDVHVAAVISSAGNCSAAQAARNAAAVLAAADHSGVPIAAGIEPDGKDYSQSPHGSDGLGNTGLGVSSAELSALPAPALISEMADPTRDLLCLAPLTNVAAALRDDPGVLERYRRVVIMGGMGPRANTDRVLAGYPQFLIKGDTNTNHDPAATAAVAAAAGAVVWVGMNVTAPLHVPFTLFERAEGVLGEFVRSISAGYAEYATRMYESAELIVTAHDSVAAAVLAQPGVVVESEKGTGEVIRADGCSALWATGDGPHEFATAVDYQAVLERIQQTIGAC
ncbi:nucleoside hydrolase [Hoyosella subflava]|uniref:Purine nucleosidase n=1 Tax=Hoyosella subflava (strain DSM 45089 / JCM 17490 / NBRC 109087 / DQS3-9A1) TaxID=443218 RepID=F6ESG9_HOYSD|nr:nucleoside hydrolase [Hoyosella subflava]AEF43090.1 Purine nucleosidase [Hoyosella subflava DQS3-9A1]